MLFAPGSQVIRERSGEPLRHMIVVMIAVNTDGSARQFPENFRQNIQQRYAPGLAERIVQIIGKGNRGILRGIREGQGIFPCHLGLVRKNGRYPGAEFLAHFPGIRLVGHLNKPVHRLGI